MNDPAITEEQAMALLEAELAAVEAKSASASSRAATRKKEREMLEMRDETCSPASNQKAAAEELTTEPRAQEPVVATAAENAWIARAESESSNDCMTPQKSASSRPTTEAEEHNTLLSSIKGGLTSLTTALADAVTTSDTNSTTCESKGTCTNSEGMEATKLERQLSEAGSLLVGIADAQSQGLHQEQSAAHWNRRNQGKLKLGIDVECEARNIVQEIESLRLSHLNRPKVECSNEIVGLSYIEQLRALRPDNDQRLPRDKATEQTEQVQILLTNMLAQTKQVGQEEVVEEVQVTVAHDGLKSLCINQDEQISNDAQHRAEDTREGLSEQTSILSESLDQSEVNAVAEVPQQHDQGTTEVHTVADMEVAADQDPTASKLVGAVDCVYDTAMSNRKGADVEKMALKRQAHDMETLRGMEEIAKVLHSLNQHPEAMSVERQARDIRRELGSLRLIPDST